jgi:DNA polymerase III subunit epsilon
MSRLVVLDTETTGLSAENGDRIVEIGCVELVHRRLTGRNLHLYLNPERESDEGALKVHGLTTEFLREKPKFAAIADEFLAYVEGADIIIHNAAFDVGFLTKELERVGRKPFKHWVASVTDTLAMAKQLFPGKRHSLDALCDRFGVDNSNRTLHGALLDAELLADVYINLTRGQDPLLADVEAAPQSAAVQANALDLSTLALPVVSASAHELDAHADMLKQLDKSSGGKTVWRLAEPEIG